MLHLERILRDTHDAEARVLYVKGVTGRRWGVVLRRAGEVTGMGDGDTLVEALIQARRQELEAREASERRNNGA